ncbi:MAG TPA: winged helix-turn-helix domain-containing tetratricopeptide repeat protein [Xanthobacteraceae bacterium]
MAGVGKLLYSFEDFVLDGDRRELRRGDEVLALQPQVFDLLEYLIRQRDRVVSKDDMISAVWGGRVVSETALTSRINAARTAVGDTGEDQRLIRTLPRKGIRFVGAVRERRSAVVALAPRTEPTERPSIAVLPFQNMSGDPEQEYFADGMVEEIITGLSRIKWLAVISRNSTFIYKNKPMPMQEVAEKFRVRYVLEGSVRKSANRVRITAQLIDAQTGAHLWAEQYDRVLEDVFALQDEITMHVVGAIEPSVRKAEIDRVRRQRPNNLNAYDLLLRSLPFLFPQRPQDATAAIPLLEDAVKLQPDYGAAHAFLGWCLHTRFAFGEKRDEDRIAAIQHAHAAIAYGSDDATALAVAAYVIAYDDHDTATALQLFDRALELSSSNVFALSMSAMTLAWMGRAETAIERAERAIRLSPFDPYNFRSRHALAIVCFHRRQYAGAVDAARDAIRHNPQFGIARAVLAAALLRSGRAEEAKAAGRDLLKCEPNFTIGGRSRTAGFQPAVFAPFAEAWREIGLPE